MCDKFLHSWIMTDYPSHSDASYRANAEQKNECANLVPPEEVAARYRGYNQGIVDGGGDPDPDYSLVVFHANAKHGFIMRLVELMEYHEDAFSVA